MSKLKIKTKERRFETARDLYGIFFEDINRAGDGGLYPEMLRNRSFEDSVLPEGYIQQEDGIHVKTVSGWLDEFCNGEGLCRWVKGNNISETEIPAWYTHNAKMELELTDTLNEHRDAALRMQFEKDGSLTNTGYCGISVKAGESYSLYLFAKAKEEIGLDVAIEYQGKVLAGNSLVVSGQEYTRYDMKLTAAEDCHEAQLTISCKEGGEVLLGFISLMPDNTYMGHGLRTDLVEKLKGMSPKFMRFPGGCIVEGTTPSTAMRFRDTVGPAWERPSKLFVWHYRSTLGLGFHEYLQLCEDLGMEPLYVCNCGMTCQGRKSVLLEGEALDEMVQDTLDAIEYAIGSKESKWGRLRASMGHPEPPVPVYSRYPITLPLLHCSQCHICPLPDMNLHQTARLVLPMHVDPEPLSRLLCLFYSLFHRYSDLFSGNNTSRSHFWYLSANPLIPGSHPDLTLILSSLRQLRFSAASFPAAFQVQNLSYNNPVRLPDYRNSRLLWNIHPP